MPKTDKELTVEGIEARLSSDQTAQPTRDEIDFLLSLVKSQEAAPSVAPVVDNLQRRLYEECVTANWDPERKNTFAEEIAHLHEELSEAFRAWRRYKDCEVREVSGKLEGVPIEFADALIGMFYNAEFYGFDLLAAVERKHQFNLKRNYVAEGRQLHAPAPASPVAPVEQSATEIVTQIRDRLINGDPRSLLADIADLVSGTATPQGESKCEHGIPWSMECLSCGHSDYVPASPAALRDEAQQCPVTCADFSMYLCGDAHRCVLDAGHPFDPYYGGGIHEFETHPAIVKPRKVAATTPPSTPAKAAAEEIGVQTGIAVELWDDIAALIERCFSGGGESGQSDAS